MSGPFSDKGDRALELHEKGIEISVIAVRLGLSRTAAYSMIARAKERRVRLAKQVVSE